MPRRGSAKLLDILPSELTPSLISFADHIATLDVDYIIFMARKAVRLHDLLIAAGSPQPRATIVTDHILDQSLDHLAGKSVALVDDTLIVGTTLAEAHRKLEAAGVTDIKKIVFAIDQDNWCEELCKVDRHFARLSERQMLTFCAAEVEALSLAGIPYLTDFPFSRRIRVTRAQLEMLYAQPGWDSYSLTTEMQEAEDVFYYTHLPTTAHWAHFSDVIGQLWRIVEIAKVRSFVFTPEHRQHHLARVIPIVTLQPLDEDRIADLFDRLLKELNEIGDGHTETLRRHLTGARAKLRFLQYFLGLVVGEDYLINLATSLERQRPLTFDPREAVRLFGPWLRPEIDALHVAAAALARGGHAPRMPRAVTRPAPLPAEVRDVGRIDLETLFGQRDKASDQEPRTLFSDLVRIFVELHQQYEIPARREVHTYGARIEEASPDEAPGRNRLKMGITWGVVSDFLSKRAKSEKPFPSMQLSLMLDALIDIGVAVPILADRDGTFFRAYRHGEDALFAENEAALAYFIAKGFLDGAGRPDIPRLTLEKLLVALQRVGVNRKFLTPHFGLNGGKTVLRIAFHRHGAIATIPDEPSVFADNQESWLSRQLVSQGVLNRVGEAYQLGSEPSAGVLQENSRHEAHKLGLLIGMLNAQREGGAPLGQGDLTLLMTCPQARDTTGAVLAEYVIFDRWFAGQKERLGRLNFQNNRSCAETLQSLTRSGGYSAFNSARYKLCGYFSGKPLMIMNECADALRQGGVTGAMAASEWEVIIKPLIARVNDDERHQFEQHLGHLAKRTLRIAVGMFSMELAIVSALLARGSIKASKFKQVCKKVLAYLDELSANLPPDEDDTALNNLRARCHDNSPLPTPEDAYRFGLRLIDRNRVGGDIVAARAEEDLRRYARLTPAEVFDQALWFEIFPDADKDAGSPQSHNSRDRNWHFMRRVATEIGGLGRDARRASARITIVPGSLDTVEGEKTLLFSGRSSRSWLGSAALKLLSMAQEEGIRLHMLVINADFAGSSPYVFVGDPAIQGRDFWDFSRHARNWVKREAARWPRGRSTVWFGGELVDLSKSLGNFRWANDPVMTKAPLALGERRLDVLLRGGPAIVRT